MAEVRAVITDTGALAACEAMIREHLAEAVAALGQAPYHGRGQDGARRTRRGRHRPLRLSGALRPAWPAAQSARACARRFTSVQRRSVIAWIGVPGSESSAVKSHRNDPASSNPQSKSTVSVPCRPLTI